MQPNTTIPEKAIKIYTVILSQTGTDAPTVIATLQNDLEGTPVWTRATAGVYKATITTEEFTEDKTIGGQITGTGGTDIQYRWSSNEFRIETRDAAGTAQDAWLDNTTIEIRVYA